MVYKRKNEVTPDKHRDYIKWVLLTHSDFKNTGKLLQVVIVPPHTVQKKHSHVQLSEFYYFLDGEAVVEVNGTEYRTVAGDTFFLVPGDIHAIKNNSSQELSYLLFKFDHPEKGDDIVWEK